VEYVCVSRGGKVGGGAAWKGRRASVNMSPWQRALARTLTCKPTSRATPLRSSRRLVSSRESTNGPLIQSSAFCPSRVPAPAARDRPRRARLLTGAHGANPRCVAVRRAHPPPPTPPARAPRLRTTRNGFSVFRLERDGPRGHLKEGPVSSTCWNGGSLSLLTMKVMSWPANMAPE